MIIELLYLLQTLIIFLFSAQNIRLFPMLSMKSFSISSQLSEKGVEKVLYISQTKTFARKFLVFAILICMLLNC